jgi:hypothetical protein
MRRMGRHWNRLPGAVLIVQQHIVEQRTAPQQQPPLLRRNHVQGIENVVLITRQVHELPGTMRVVEQDERVLAHDGRDAHLPGKSDNGAADGPAVIR